MGFPLAVQATATCGSSSKAARLRRCIVALRTLEADPVSVLDEDVAQFLHRKSHIAAREEGGYELTDRGRESLADISAQEPKR